VIPALRQHVTHLWS